LAIYNTINKILLPFGFQINRVPENVEAQKTFDEIHQILNNEEKPIIFDVGANEGQSIARFRQIFPTSIIHSFEPQPKECEIIQKKYASNNTFINNAGLGSTEGKKKFYVNWSSSSSSFIQLNLNSEGIRKSSEHYGVPSEKYIVDEIEANIFTLDSYVKKNNITKIDILKIDTQGFEDEVLKGAENSLKSNIINTIEMELLVGDNYEKRVTFSDVGKYLIPYGYRLYAISRGGNLYDYPALGFDIIYTLDKNIK